MNPQRREISILKTVDIYTDGACSGNPGPGGYAAALIYKGRQKEISEGFADTTNNRMELSACIAGLGQLKEPCRVNLYSDSKYVINGINEGWVRGWKQNGWMRNRKEEAKNADLWEELLGLLDTHDVSFIWVKGHADNPYNELCDRLAREAAESRRT